jgi:type IV pilus assembly protein PilC
MPEYWYEALTATGTAEEGWLTAADEQEIEERLRAAGSFLVRAEVRPRPRPAVTHTDGKVDRAELLAFTEYMASSVQVGIPMLTALDDLEERLQTRRMKRIVREVRHSMAEEGKALSEALEAHPKAFSPLYVGTIAAGEASGHLDYVLKQLVEHLDWQQEITSHLRQATTYPIIVLLGVGAVILILLAVVYPRLLPILTSRDVELPLPTRILMTTSIFLRARWYVLLLGLAGTAIAVTAARATETGRRLFDTISLKVPVFGRISREVNMARLVTYLGLFYRSGVELILGLTLVERMMGNRVVASAVREAREAVVGGQTMSSAFGRSGLFPPMVVRAIALGESTGSLDETLRRVQTYYQREIPVLVRRMTTALQPMLVILLGGVILMVALSIVLPIMSIYESIGRR